MSLPPRRSLSLRPQPHPPVPFLRRSKDVDNRLRALSSVHPERPSSTSEIIGWYLRNGFTMEQVRAMFPAFFVGDPEP
jgi:hypothetical protein